MGSFSDLLENGVLDHIFENTALTIAAPIEIALWVGDPLDTGAGGAEAAYTNYARQTIAFDAAAARLINQTSQVDFPQCGASGQAGITHYAIFDSTGTPKFLAHGALSGTVNVVTGNTPSIAAGEVDISITASGGTAGMTTYCAHKVLDFVFRGQAFAQPTISLALTTSTLADTTTTLTGEEVASANNYSRLLTPNWDAASGGALANTGVDTFATPSGSWGTIVAAAVMDSNTHNAGNALFFDNAIVDQAVGNGDTIRFNAGDFDVILT